MNEFDYYRNKVDEPDFSKDVWSVILTRPYYHEVYFYYSEEDADKSYKQIMNEECNGEKFDCYLFISKVLKGSNVVTDY